MIARSEPYYPLMVGFSGTSPLGEEAQALKAALSRGLICGLIFFRHNVESPSQLASLTHGFLDIDVPLPPLLAVDQEGGRVQRLSSVNGFCDFPSAHEMAKKDKDQRLSLYTDFARQIKEAGLNYVLGPVVDLHSDASPVIGALGRAYGSDPAHVEACARDFVEAHGRLGIVTSLKHFPGHGFALGDTHKGFVDVTQTFHADELEPFRNLALKGGADSIMVAHVAHDTWDQGVPASLSSHTRKILRDQWGYDGVVISDDLHMGAIVDAYPDPCLVGAMAARAGVDLLLYSYNPMASQGEKGFSSLSLEALQEGIRCHLGDDFEKVQRDATRRVDALRRRVSQEKTHVLCG